MTAINVSIKDLVYILEKLEQDGTKMVNIDVVPDDSSQTNMNKIIVHPVEPTHVKSNNPTKIIIRNPNFSTENNDIFGSLNELL